MLLQTEQMGRDIHIKLLLLKQVCSGVKQILCYKLWNNKGDLLRESDSGSISKNDNKIRWGKAFQRFKKKNYTYYMHLVLRLE